VASAVLEPPSALDVAGGQVRVGEPAFVGGRLHWISTPPDGSGGSVLVSGAVGSAPRLESPLDVALRSRLYLYGAGAWCATPVGLVGIESRTQQLGRVSPHGFEPLGSKAAPHDALGDPTPVPGSTWVVLAAEHPAAPRTWCGLAAVNVETGVRASLLVADGRCAEPQVSADGSRVAWLEWPFGSMPWDAAVLRVAALDVTGGSISCGTPRRVDGGRGASAGQPTWRPDGSLVYVTEAAGFWQPWVCDDGGAVRRLSGRRAEFQRPRWHTCRWFAALESEGSLACALADSDGEHVGILSDDGGLEVLDQPCVRVDGIAAGDGVLGWVGATTTAQGAVATWPAAEVTAGAGRVGWVVDPAPASGAPTPERFEFRADGVELDGVVWGATRPSQVGPTPLVIWVHPGPTGAVDRSYAPVVHLLSAHGLAVAAIDTSGSTAHGRVHRERLLGRFGELDVAECAAAADHLVATGIADRSALFIRGTSAGGTTALLSLESGHFRGAVAWYPASKFVDDDEGFEAGYLTALLGPGGEDRSPLVRAPFLRGSVLVVQGTDDPIVTPEETAMLLDALRANLALDVDYVPVEGEGHGFRTTGGRAAALDAELAFYLRVSSAARADA